MFDSTSGAWLGATAAPPRFHWSGRCLERGCFARFRTGGDRHCEMHAADHAVYQRDLF